ncbi:xanthine dehydrogenase family protein molybdopterin-binding subunit [Actinomadura soli]|uniref:Xanthine dehydrogenase family protein molybdopterin-binding subunit n=1 Tax=Actinomadura soli TaxID=2508997 RepID=A0A5C4JGZ5_9ACTN|nr:xanthine dehydrogenase family protein molybdopterin-binding subunit [Actinomadura soli]TMR05535.1 xanthine dehydrogenase family protein molybdopterin-binding subunit [Actinomadura soli]
MTSAPTGSRAIGAPVPRLEGRAKVTGTAPYAYDQPVEAPLYLAAVTSTSARGHITAIDTAAADRLDGVVAVLTHENAPRLASDENAELWVLQSDEVAFRGQLIGAVVASRPEIAAQAAGLVRVEYDARPHDVEPGPGRDDLYAPATVNTGLETDTIAGDVDAAMADAAVTLDRTYSTPLQFHVPMEPQTAVARWDRDGGGDRLTLYDSTQGVIRMRQIMAAVLGLPPDRVEVISPHVGGGFGSKLRPKAHHVLVALAARTVEGRPVKFALPRRLTFAGSGYRPSTVQRIRLGADADGRLTAIAHDAVGGTSKLVEFAEQTALATRTMYAAPNRRTTHRLAALDVSVPTVMRAPGEAPGMFALESAMDELAVACGLDPIELRVRNEPGRDPETGLPYSTRNLVACLREGARRFGWTDRDPAPAARLDDGWLTGTGVAAATYPAYPVIGPSNAAIRALAGGRYRVDIAAADIGTGSRTALTQIAADALAVPLDAVDLRLGESTLPAAAPAAGSMGLGGWGSAVIAAARAFREKYGTAPAEGAEAGATGAGVPGAGKVALHAFGAQFAEVRVHADTGEIRVPRLLGVFAVGRVVNPRTARSQLTGGMVMGLSAALHEHGVMDPGPGQVVTRDLADYHIAAHADVQDVDAVWIDEADPHYNELGAKGVGEIGIVGVAAAIANAAFHATGVRVRDLPLTPDAFLR